MTRQTVQFGEAGVAIRGLLGRRLSLAYGEILTAERLPSGFGMRLHSRTTDHLRIWCGGARRNAIEDELRRRGVRIVDEYGAMITPTLGDFEAELACDPQCLRQSSDSA
jgi:hypothetical protein